MCDDPQPAPKGDHDTAPFSVGRVYDPDQEVRRVERAVLPADAYVTPRQVRWTDR